MGDLKFQIQHYAAEMWKRKWGILLAASLVGLVSSYFAATKADVFTSRATVRVDENAMMNAVLPREALRANPEREIDAVRSSIYARPNLEKLIIATDLHLDLKDQRQWEGVVENLEEKLELKRPRPDFYTIEYTHSNPTLARDMVQAALDMFVEQSAGGTGDGSEKEEARRFLQTELDEAQRKLGIVQAEIAELERERPDVVAGPTALIGSKGSLERRLGNLRSDRNILNSAISSLTSRLASEPRQVFTRMRTVDLPQQTPPPPPSRQKVPVPGGGPTPEEMRAERFAEDVSRLRLEYQTLIERVTPQHPDATTLQRRLQVAESDLANLQAGADAARASQQSRIQQAVEQNAQADAAYEQWLFQTSQMNRQASRQEPVYEPNPRIPEMQSELNERRSRLANVERELREAEAELSQLETELAGQPEFLQRYERLVNQERKLAGEVERLEDNLANIAPGEVALWDMRIIEPPTAPVTPTGPNRLLLFMGSAILAVGCGTGLGFLRVQLADNIPTLTHLKQGFDLPILGGVSMIEDKGDVAKRAASNLLFLACVAALVTIFCYVVYRYHFDLWRPDINGFLTGTSG